MKGPVIEQPKQYPGRTMGIYSDYLKESLLATEVDWCQDHDHAHGVACCERGGGNGRPHRNCHASRRRTLFILFGVLLLLGVLLMSICAYHSFTSGTTTSGFWESTMGGLGGLVKRGPGDPQGDNGVFIDRKYYLIIIFVGLLLVVILGIMLSAWCCRGAFQNPLCCPCYLCACCGGLACLECIGCGLCAEGLSDM